MASACECKKRLWVYAMGGGQTLFKGHSFILRAHTNSQEHRAHCAEVGACSGGHFLLDIPLGPCPQSWECWAHGNRAPRPQWAPAPSCLTSTVSHGVHRTEGPGRLGTSLTSFSHFEDGETKARGSSVLTQVSQPMSHDMEARTHVTCSESGLSFFLNLFFLFFLNHRRKEDHCSSKTRAYIQKKLSSFLALTPGFCLPEISNVNGSVCASHMSSQYFLISHTRVRAHTHSSLTKMEWTHTLLHFWKF